MPVSAISDPEAVRIVIAGGGTGGHLYPGLALAEAIQRQAPGSRIVFMGTPRGLEARVVPREGYELVLLPVRGLLRKVTLENLLFPFRLLWSVIRSMLFFRRFRPQLVIGTGGYVSGPALIAAQLMRIPTVIQEQNSYPGLVNRWLGKHATAVFLAFESARRYFPKSNRVFVEGNPVRGLSRDVNRDEAYRRFGLKPDVKTVLIFGGSQGARKLNEIVGRMLSDTDFVKNKQILWITGPKWFEAWRHYHQTQHGRIRVLDYCHNMHEAYAVADLAVCRAGALTIAELTIWGIPAIYVPFPFATADHQTQNARAVADAGGGLVLPESELSEAKLAKTIESVLQDDEKLHAMAEAARRLGRPEAADRIAEKCLQWIRKP